MEEQTKNYTIVLTLFYGGSSNPSTYKIETWFSEPEAQRCAIMLNKKIELLEKHNIPVSLSLTCRNQEGDLVYYGISNIYSICHNITAFNMIEE